MTKSEAKDILTSMTKGESLLRHARSVELVMEAYGKHFGEDAEEWAVTGMLHDADYEAYPEEHPNRIVKMLREMGEEKIAHAISAHYTKWNVPYETKLDKALLACDELTGFIIACCQIRPEGVVGLTPKSVKKKLKQKSFAAKVERDEIQSGVDLLEVDLTEHIQFIINVLNEHKEELKIG
ncbi:HD domain-containing protein [Roseivirga pacifica]|uniref:HD domain-containing protein n=1 Tax=Roseivirga pacifica TaxID=1267423 RepID=UPI002094D8F0|nr:HD domain-containing protein [Roseivirga pacifica]MCO6360390.1 metal-dependent phosphohydrolase [Roseivirga pacifica]MCO6368279.1 metal-dependent phosphohydrolase [Roseivirga pacifica]MCO6372421.1 metal-dependent phosphohydrolase [Roseivirga pacifica]MCO6376479.1 metal-dependent phosphohydrolase [Roseivirga pacifica]MCO6378241.1 metal-dependent phosphohydrolase [Roseivirga pacifica]